MTTPPLYTTREAARLAGLSRARVNVLARQGRCGQQLAGGNGAWVFTDADLAVLQQVRPSGNPNLAEARKRRWPAV